MQATNISMLKMSRSEGTGGFLDPESISNEFGIKEGMAIADFGCGAGYFTAILSRKTGKSGRVYALDIQAEALENVSAKARKDDLANLQTIRTNLEILGGSSLSNNSQDIVLLANILFQSNKKKEIIQEAARVLKKGGRAIIIDWKKGANGFGPPENLRMTEADARSFAEQTGLIFVREINAGNFHFGTTFIKK
ncbi:MAG: hypothetical protein A3B99_03400 [Candidatus Yanofskybacteria bacterium RIFCSPHIGHO2_02_FULL_44_12b]|uniref:Methyltransferase domain-containing protein n=2 Tax=Candidatus Yanofskyibacteriota TaxID=1752733 RepID=A0A1F8GLP6_9BACT|nr:MAG: hypothetical protein A2659_02600 [Candidatus Yanofskybacteria bacterium RIFCSPHIGHO2_01_FULL_44_24]OGN13970.1 MAG: hypothetical protein A3B99_03400 [Candidatus Yanofskybacteria bacterium RIFCSPHIGHO2_02_FULL_44_12b]OGN26334.1 MAG: hypothetical protein A2925_00375 [Candidatus Yanofskybacteria bacterium RIFCSPLOWO2_01_FULL_44_22]